MTSDEPAESQPRAAITPCSRSASRAYSEHVGANRHARGRPRGHQPLIAADHRRRRSAEPLIEAARPGNRRQRRPQLACSIANGAVSAAGRPTITIARLRRSRVATGAVGLAQPTPRAVPLHGVLQLSAHSESGARRLRRFPPEDDEGRPIDSSASLEERLKISAGGQPLASRKATRYTVSRLRPLARRRLSTLRPPFVRHALAKAVRLRSPASIGLKRPLHERAPLAIVEPAQCRQRCAHSQPTKLPRSSYVSTVCYGSASVVPVSGAVPVWAGGPARISLRIAREATVVIPDVDNSVCK